MITWEIRDHSSWQWLMQIIRQQITTCKAIHWYICFLIVKIFITHVIVRNSDREGHHGGLTVRLRLLWIPLGSPILQMSCHPDSHSIWWFQCIDNTDRHILKMYIYIHIQCRCRCRYRYVDGYRYLLHFCCVVAMYGYKGIHDLFVH